MSIIPVPQPQEHASIDQQHLPGHEKDLKEIGLPPALLPDWKEQAILKLGELLDKSQALRVFMDICVRCGACSDKCHYYLGTGDPKNMPVARAELLRKVYRRYYTLAGQLFPEVVGAEELTEEVLQEWFTYFYQCSECRRCSVFCPYGIDTAEITIAAREIMASIGMVPRYTSEVIAQVYRTGNNLGMPGPAWIDNLEFLAEEIQDETGLDIPMPVNQKGAEVLLVPPSADNLVNVETMMGYAKVFFAAGISWTTSTYASEAANFGLFLNYDNMQKINQRILKAARELEVKRIVWGECGHAWRAALYTQTLSGSMDFLEVPYPVHICQFTLDLLRRGAFKLDPSVNDEYTVTYHDPCNVARAGQLVEEPRELLRAVCNHFVEMPADTIREKTFCCGGGGGLLTSEIMDLRVAGSKPRAEALRQTGANRLATICAICKAQFQAVLPKHKLEAEVCGVHDLIGNALVLGG